MFDWARAGGGFLGVVALWIRYAPGFGTSSGTFLRASFPSAPFCHTVISRHGGGKKENSRLRYVKRKEEVPDATSRIRSNSQADSKEKKFFGLIYGRKNGERQKDGRHGIRASRRR